MKDITTLESMKEELSKLEQALATNKRRQEALSKGDAAPKHGESKLQQLKNLGTRVECLALEQDLNTWAEEFSSSSSTNNLFSDAIQCLGLGQVLCRHSPRFDTSNYGELYASLYQQEYLPLHGYVQSTIVSLLRKSLLSMGYPSEQACHVIVQQCQGYQKGSDNKDDDTVAWCCDWLNRLQAGHHQLAIHMDPNNNNSNNMVRSAVVMELCRPLLDRLRFHFVETAPDRLTSSRIDRLPEWLFNYVREHILLQGGPWEMVLDGIAPIVSEQSNHIAALFLREVVHLAEWVLTERNFFRHDVVAGPESNPRILCNGIEQLLIFDTYTRDLLPLSREDWPGLTNRFVVEDEELWRWWLDRENEWILSALFQTSVEESSTTLLDPRAELFCALIQSVKCKANVLSSTSSSVYIGRVAVPACMEFLDAIHTSSKDLKSLLCQRDADLENNTTCWMEVINGTHLASLVLSSSSSAGDTESDNDLTRVGRSMERLRDVLVEEFVTALVETVLMERAKLASYLMRCSHLLSSTDPLPNNPSLSPDLHDVVTMLSTVVKICSMHLSGDKRKECTQTSSDQAPDTPQDLLMFAPQSILTALGSLVPEKFLEVALDSHGMTPDIMLNGASVFRHDVNLIVRVFDKKLQNKSFRRLLDVTKFMTTPSDWLHSLRQALLGLVQYQEGFVENQGTLLIQHFSSDNTLFEQAKSMVEAKGFPCLELEDAISILNRRKD